MLPVPWRERHAGVVYAGAPVGSPLAELLTPTGGGLGVSRHRPAERPSDSPVGGTMSPS